MGGHQFCLRAARYGSWELSASSPDVTLAALRLRKGARFLYEYDLNIPRRHEVRIDNQLGLEAGKAYPVCTGGGGACPPEDCDGPPGFMAGRNGALSLDVLEDLDTMTEIIGQVVLERRTELLEYEDTRWRLEEAVERSKAREHAQGQVFSRRTANARLRRDEHVDLMHRRNLEQLRPAPGQQVGGDQGSVVASPLADAGDQRVGSRVGDPVKAALQRGSRRCGVEPGRGDALVAEEALQVGDVHAEREQARRHRMAQQVRVNALGDPGSTGYAADHLANALAG